MSRFRSTAFALAGFATAAASSAQSAQTGGLGVLSAEFGSLGAARKLDITRRLQQLCGAGAMRCDVFCSETSFGRYALGRRPICRVSYRCPDGSTRAAEAAREEPIMLRCRDDDADVDADPPEPPAPGQ